MTEQEFLERLAPLEPYLYRMAVAVTGNRDDARDALQEALLAAFVAREQLKEAALFKPWVRKIVLRQCSRLLAARGRVFLLENPEDCLVHNAGEQVEQDQVLTWVLVRQLPLLQSQVVILRYLADFTQKEIAGILQIPEGTVKSRLNRALTGLRKALAEQKEARTHEM